MSDNELSIEESRLPVATTTSGMVMGREKNGVLLFCGIPYAAAPVGDRRFKRPAAPESWSDVRDATRFSPAAPQLPTGGMTNRVPVPWDEDCLYLNVTTPALDDDKRAVLVWIHGGAYRTGQGAVPWYNGTSFALNGDIVTVSINYRLGALGFTDFSRFGDEYATSGINGTLDQIHALKWVQENIASFGGDPSRVTIAGESAGGFSVTTLLGCEQAQGLFHRAIPQSGAAHHTLSKEAGERVADLLIETLGVKSISDLHSVGVLDILKAQPQVDEKFRQTGLGRGVSAFYPVEMNAVLPEGLIPAIKRGVGADIPVLTGTNKDENTLFLAGRIEEAELRRQVKVYGGDALLNAYRAMLPGASSTELAVAIGTDFSFKIPAVRLAEMREKQGADTWLYQFDWESRLSNLKATHALEIPFAFNTLGAAGVKLFLGPGDLPQPVADEMHDIWTRFIQGEDPDWPRYDSERRSTWHFDNESKLVENGELDRLEAWQGIR
jgi:para-nitrobenzyl esterase